MDNKIFAKQLEELEKIVKSLESNDISLEDAIEQFNAGIKLSQSCEQKLKAAEQQVNAISTNSNGEMIEEPLDLGTNNA